MKNSWEKPDDYIVIFANGGGRVHEILIDEADFKIVSAFSGMWGAHKHRNTFYAWINVRGTDGKRKTVQMHRVLLNPPSDLQVDHKNRDGLDNRRENIRIATNGENARNRINNVKLQSDVDGVSYHTRDKLWMVQIWGNGRVEYNACFRDQAAAEKAAHRFLETGERTTREGPAEFHSGIKGITWHVLCKAWQVTVTANGKRIFLGLYDAIPEAHATLLMFLKTGMFVKRSRKCRHTS